MNAERLMFIEQIKDGKWFKVADKYDRFFCKLKYDAKQETVFELYLSAYDPEVIAIREYSEKLWDYANGVFKTYGSWVNHIGDSLSIYDDHGNIVAQEMVSAIVESYESKQINLVSENELLQIWETIANNDSAVIAVFPVLQTA